jgi:hypothetical protein
VAQAGILHANWRERATFYTALFQNRNKDFARCHSGKYKATVKSQRSALLLTRFQRFLASFLFTLYIEMELVKKEEK